MIEFNGQTIHIAEEMNLTEMFKASGKDRNFGPAEWTRYTGAEFLKSFGENTGSARNLIRTARGRKGGTFAHWQIGMEYARYLSPELAAICNQIVKDFVEAKPENMVLSKDAWPLELSLEPRPRLCGIPC